MEVLNLVFAYFGGWVFPYISRIHTAYIGEDFLRFRYLKCLVKQWFTISEFPSSDFGWWKIRVRHRPISSKCEKSTEQNWQHLIPGSNAYLFRTHLSHRIHVWFICLHLLYHNQPDIGTYTVHGWYGFGNQATCRQFAWMWGISYPSYVTIIMLVIMHGQGCRLVSYEVGPYDRYKWR